MRFQGENCTLSFGLYFDSGHVVLSGTVWHRRSSSPQARQEANRLRFQSQLTEDPLTELREWLTNDSTAPFTLAEPVRLIRRLPPTPDGVTQLELELTLDQVPPWWDWDISFPLTVRLEIRPNEFNYLTNTLSRDYWSADLTW